MPWKQVIPDDVVMTDREQFEEAMRRVYGKGMPDAEEMQWAWQGWQAARAAPVEQPSDEAVEDAIEKAFWQFDARRKGYAKWEGTPQSERDAFKAECRILIKEYYPTWTSIKRHMLAVAGAFIRGQQAARAAPAQDVDECDYPPKVHRVARAAPAQANAMRCDFCNVNFADRQPGSVCPRCYRELSPVRAAPAQPYDYEVDRSKIEAPAQPAGERVPLWRDTTNKDGWHVMPMSAEKVNDPRVEYAWATIERIDPLPPT
jgi:hypothetical protein